MSPKIFISYRRADGSYIASAISDSLAAHFGRDAVLLDIDFFEPGVSFQDAIENTIRESTVVLAIIGPAWGTAESADGRRRMDDPSDFVRLELETAFTRRIPVIPILVGDAIMPSPNELPNGLAELAYINAAEFRSGRDIAENIDRLVKSIEHFIIEANPDVPILQEPILSRPEIQSFPPEVTVTGKEEKPAGSVFISYRREGGAETARLMRYELLARGWQVFLDVEDLKAGLFDEDLLAEVVKADNFLLILSKNALKNCTDPDDWLHKEISEAIETKRNIVPLLKEHASPPGDEMLPADIETLGKFNCVEYSHIYYEPTVSRLLSFLKSSTT